MSGSLGAAARLPLNVRHVIAVGSGKGGVGKSTCTVNLASALHVLLGKKVGILDADLYGPSIPKMLGIPSGEQPKSIAVQGGPRVKTENRMIPATSHLGIKCMSMDLLIRNQNDALVWRGPMIQKALTQLAHQTHWGAREEKRDTPEQQEAEAEDLDYLLVDLPPGTGDVHITLAQTIKPIAGAVLVSTPQDVALLDVRRCITMLEKMHIPMIGLIQNMSSFVCQKCSTKAEIFGSGANLEQMCEDRGLKILAEVPIDADIASSSDGGTPKAAKDPQSLIAQEYVKAAREIIKFTTSAS